MTVALVNTIVETPTANADRGLGVLVPVSPLTQEPLNVGSPVDAIVTDREPATVVERPPGRVYDSRRWYTRLLVTAQRRAAGARETFSRAVAWLREGTAQIRSDAAAWRVARRYEGRHHVRVTVHGRERSTYQCAGLTHRRRAARESHPEGDLPVPRRDELVPWLESWIEAMRGYDEVCHPRGSVPNHEGYRFRCS